MPSAGLPSPPSWGRAGAWGEASAAAAHSPSLAAVVETLLAASRSEGPKRVAAFLNALDPSGRWALLKLVTGGLRIGVSARLAKQALADLGGREVLRDIGFDGICTLEVAPGMHGATPAESRPDLPNSLALWRGLMQP